MHYIGKFVGVAQKVYNTHIYSAVRPSDSNIYRKTYHKVCMFEKLMRG